MKLISMTDFVFKCRENKGLDNIRRFWTCERYAKFLKQPLELWMFVPCDEDGNVLEKPHQYEGALEFAIGKDYIEALSYKQAKERCLFEGFKLIRNEDNFFIIEKEDISLNLRILKSNTKTNIEILLKWGEIKLTPTAIKQIGL